jgi:hypothetical protein
MFFYSAIIILVAVISRKIVALHYDASVEHEIWQWQRYGYKEHMKLKNPVPMGIIFPLLFSVFTLGLLKITTFLTYETHALKRRAAKRVGYYSYTEMTEWHNAIIGATGIFAVLILAALAYILPFQGVEMLAALASYYAFWNLLPVSKLDGTQIFFGSRVLYIFLAIITLIFTAFSLFQGLPSF